jgi:hypothetical protein
MASEVSQLSEIITSSVQELLELSTTNNWSLPALNEPFSPSKNIFRENPDASYATAKIIATAVQLATTLMDPGEALRFIVPVRRSKRGDQLHSSHQKDLKSAALSVCFKCNVPEILREAGPNVRGNCFVRRGSPDGYRACMSGISLRNQGPKSILTSYVRLFHPSE